MTSDTPLRQLSEHDFDVCFVEQPTPPTPQEDLQHARGRHQRRVRANLISTLAVLVLVAGVGWALAGTSQQAVPAGPATSPSDRDPSGLRLITEDDYANRKIPTTPPELESALTFARVLSDENRSDFGFPSVEGDKVVLPATSARSAPIAEASTGEGRAQALVVYDNTVRASYPSKTNPPDLLAKRLKLTSDKLQQFSAHVDVTPGGRSIQAAYQLVPQVFEVARAGRPAGTVLGCGYDEVLDLVVLDLSQPSPAIASALVAKFGTETVGLHIDSSSNGTADEVGDAHLTGYLPPVAPDLVTVRAVTGEGDVVTAASAQETDEQVRVRITIKSPAGPGSDVGIFTDQVIHLQRPLAGRTVIDDATGDPLPLLRK